MGHGSERGTQVVANRISTRYVSRLCDRRRQSETGVDLGKVNVGDAEIESHGIAVCRDSSCKDPSHGGQLDPSQRRRTVGWPSGRTSSASSTRETEPRPDGPQPLRSRGVAGGSGRGRPRRLTSFGGLAPARPSRHSVLAPSRPGHGRSADSGRSRYAPRRRTAGRRRPASDCRRCLRHTQMPVDSGSSAPTGRPASPVRATRSAGRRVRLR